MKPISTLVLSFSFIGSFLGAGYISGQETLQFFGNFGVAGFLGLVVAIGILSVFNLMIIRIVRYTKCTQIDRVVVGSDNKILLFITGVVEGIVFFGTSIVMTAGFGALVEKLTGHTVGFYIGSLVFSLGVSYLSIKGIKGLVRILSFAVPVLVVITVSVCIYVIATYGKNGFDLSASAKFNPLIPNWFAGGVTFASYNLFCAVGVLCPVGLMTKSKKSAVTGTLLGGLFLIIVAVAIILSMGVMPQAKNEELPMMDIANSISPAITYVYAFLMFLAMLGASIACTVPVITYISDNSPACGKHPAIISYTMGLSGFLLSCFGFSNLVGTLFSSFGYIALIGLFGITRHYLKIRRLQKNELSQQK